MAKVIEVTQTIASPPHDVWALLETPGHLEECHPFVLSNPVDTWPGPGSRDEIIYHNGRHVTRTIHGWFDGEGFDLTVSDGSGPVADVSWRLGAASGGCTLSLALDPRMLDGVPRAARPAWSAVVRTWMRRYLRSVVRGVEWRVTTGEQVSRNQFGSHVWFSRHE